MKEQLEKQERKCAKLEKDLKARTDDADQCHFSASRWKTRYMKLKIHVDKCDDCKGFALSDTLQSEQDTLQ